MSKLMLFAVVGCLVAGIVLNILVATGCNYVKGTDLPGVHLGVFQYSADATSTNAPQPEPTNTPIPTAPPSSSPSFAPTEPGATARPTTAPVVTIPPSSSPTRAPSPSPSFTPTGDPSSLPSLAPSDRGVTEIPTLPPVAVVTMPPSMPTTSSSAPTTTTTSSAPSVAPSEGPSMMPSQQPTVMNSDIPIVTASPTTSTPTVSSVPTQLNTSSGTGNLTLSPTITSIFRERGRQLQNTLRPTSSPTTTVTLVDWDTGGECKALGDNENDDKSWQVTAAQAGVILAPVCAFVVLLLVVCGTKVSIPFATLLIWTGHAGCQVGTGLVWSIGQSEFCDSNSSISGGCDWSSDAWMNLAAHIVYAIAALCTWKLPKPQKEQANDNDNDNNDDDTPTVVNTALLDAPTIGGEGTNEQQQVNDLQAELEAQKQAAAMEAGRAQAVNEQLEDQQEELDQAREKLWKAEQEAEEQRNALAAAAALTAANATVEALRAKELEERVQQQTKELETANAQIGANEALLAAAAAGSAAAVTKTAKIQALQAELEAQRAEYEAKLQEMKGPELAYYPAVWKWLGFREPETELAYYPAVWKWMGFREPSKEPYEVVAHAPDPEGATGKELQMAQEKSEYEARIKAKEDELAALVALETHTLKNELELHKKEIEEIKAATMMKGGDKNDPPTADPPVGNPDAKEPVGLRESDLAASSGEIIMPGEDPPEETFTDPANDPSGVRSSAVWERGTDESNDANKATEDPPEETYTDPANDPTGVRSSGVANQATQEDIETSPAHDPPIERMLDPAKDPEEVRRSQATEEDTDAPPAHDPPIERIPDTSNDPEEARRSVANTSMEEARTEDDTQLNLGAQEAIVQTTDNVQAEGPDTVVDSTHQEGAEEEPSSEELIPEADGENAEVRQEGKPQ